MRCKIYIENTDDLKQYRYYLKNELNISLERKLFLSPGYRKPDIVVSKVSTETSPLPQYFEHTEDGMIVKTAELLRKRVLDTISTSSDLSWPPDVDSLKNRKPTEILETFYRNLLGFNKETEKSVRIANSLNSDVLYNISNGKFLTLKHTTLGLGLHSLTDIKAPVTQLHRLGHSISYDMVCRIEIINNFTVTTN